MAVVLGCWGRAAATVLLDETWANGIRTNTNLPDESATWVSHANTTSEPNRVIVAPGSLRYDLTVASTQRLHTYFAEPAIDGGGPVSIGVGQKLQATIDFTSSETMGSGTSRTFRFGLFSTPLVDTHVQTDGASDAGGSGNPWASAQGYAAFMPLTTNAEPPQLFQITKRTAVGTGNLMGTGGNHVQATSGGGIVVAQANHDYSLRVELDRVAANQMNVTFALWDNSGELASHTVSDTLDNFGEQAEESAPYFDFDMLAFRFSGTAQTGNDITFTRFLVALVDSAAPPLPGDFNGDGSVDAADYVHWRKADGPPAEYDEWRENFGSVGGSGSAASLAVPEPTTGFMVLLAAVCAMRRRRWRLRISGCFLQE